MTRFILPIIFCAFATAAFAQPQQPPQHAQPPEGQAQIVQAALVLPAGAQPMRGAQSPAAAHATTTDQVPVEDQGERSSTLMLLAALALMTGIALRRWSMGTQ